MNAGLSLARAVADAVLYEGYLLYPYRASSAKNQSRWQFGILGPPGAAESACGEDSRMAADCLLEAGPAAEVEVYLRFLHLQSRSVERAAGAGFVPVAELASGASRWLSWDEATEEEITLGRYSLARLAAGVRLPVEVAAHEGIEDVPAPAGGTAGRLVRRRRQLHGEVSVSAVRVDDGAEAGPGVDGAGADGTGPRRPLWRISVTAVNTAPGRTADKRSAIELSFIGTHLLLSSRDADFLSVVDPPVRAAAAARTCGGHRCWPVLAGPEGQRDVLLLSPIILYDHPAVAPESSVALFDATEIDEILTLRIMTLTEAEKAEARATDARAAAIIERCENMTPEELQQLHGALRNPHGPAPGPARPGGFEFPALSVPGLGTPGRDGFGADGFGPVPGGADVPWWDPGQDAAVDPASDLVLIAGVQVSRGSRVRIEPRRRADAQDFFFAGQTGRVTGVHFDVDGGTHVAVVLEADPAAELQEWYGRYLYFAPEELVPLAASASSGATANARESDRDEDPG